MDVCKFIFLLKLFKTFSNVIHSEGGCYKRDMKYRGSIFCGLIEKPENRVNVKNIYYLAPLASFFVEPFVWSYDIANQRNRSQVGENNRCQSCHHYLEIQP